MKKITLTIEDTDTLLINDSRFKHSLAFTLTDERWETLLSGLEGIEKSAEILGEVTKDLEL